MGRPRQAGELTGRDVKNEDRTDYIYENKEAARKNVRRSTSFLHENAPIGSNRQQSVGLLARKCTGYAIIQGELAALERCPKSIRFTQDKRVGSPVPTSRSAPQKAAALHYVLQIKGVNCEEPKSAKIYVIEIKRVIYSMAPRGEKRGGKI
jgi:hypothetical protein